jgi:hypothetical protein
MAGYGRRRPVRSPDERNDIRGLGARMSLRSWRATGRRRPARSPDERSDIRGLGARMSLR